MAMSNTFNVENDYENNEAAVEVEDVSSNIDIIDSQFSGNKKKDLITNRIPLATYSGPESVEWKHSRTGAGCLGLLSILLLAGIIGLLVCYKRVTNSFKENIILYESNSTAEREQFQTKYSTVTEERDQLLLERDPLRVERDNLRANLSLTLQLIQQGWRYSNSSWYFISTVKKTWEDSRRDCEGKTADLPIINSREEQVFIHGLKNEGFWIGLTDHVQEGKWMWVDGTELTTGYWESGQPNSKDGTEEDCVSKWLGTSSPEKKLA